MKLNKANYFTKANTYVSSSKLSCFLRDKNLYKRKYIDWSVAQEKTDALIIGSAVDCLLTGTKAKFNKEFVIVDRRSSKSEDTRMQVNPTMLDKINGIVASVKRQDIWKSLKTKDFKKQVILTDDDLGICGMLDLLSVNGDHAIIVDLKTANTIDPRKYYWHAFEYGYYRQFGFYKTLVLKNYPEVKRVDCYHLAVEKDPDELYDCAVFQFDSGMIDNAIEVMKGDLQELRRETVFAPKSVGWKDKILISPIQQ